MYSIIYSVLLIALINQASSNFQDANRKWPFHSPEQKDVNCEDSEFCYPAPNDGDNDCNYEITPLTTSKFGAKITGLQLG